MQPDYIRYILMAGHAETLAKIAREDKTALALLLTLPDSPLAAIGKQEKQQDVNFLDASIRHYVGEQLATLAKDQPETRKTLVPYFMTLLQSKQVATRMFGANSLAAFGPDASAALPSLKKMGMDPSEKVRTAVTSAIAAIEKANK